eukprot:jgi/Orpsp1_1/1191575/evm.model.d7180000087111.1
MLKKKIDEEKLKIKFDDSFYVHAMDCYKLKCSLFNILLKYDNRNESIIINNLVKLFKEYHVYYYFKENKDIVIINDLNDIVILCKKNKNITLKKLSFDESYVLKNEIIELRNHRIEIINENIRNNNLYELKNYIEKNDIKLPCIKSKISEFTYDKGKEDKDVLIDIIENTNDLMFNEKKYGHKSYYDMIEYIITQYPTTNYCIYDGRRAKTPLLVALEQNKLKIAELLVKHGADIHYRFCGNLDVLYFLFKNKKYYKNSLKFLFKHNYTVTSNTIKNIIFLEEKKDDDDESYNKYFMDLIKMIYKYDLYNNDDILIFLNIYKNKRAVSNKQINSVIKRIKNKQDDIFGKIMCVKLLKSQKYFMLGIILYYTSDITIIDHLINLNTEQHINDVKLTDLIIKDSPGVLTLLQILNRKYLIFENFPPNDDDIVKEVDERKYDNLWNYYNDNPIFNENFEFIKNNIIDTRDNESFQNWLKENDVIICNDRNDIGTIDDRIEYYINYIINDDDNNFSTKVYKNNTLVKYKSNLYVSNNNIIIFNNSFSHYSCSLSSFIKNYYSLMFYAALASGNIKIIKFFLSIKNNLEIDIKYLYIVLCNTNQDVFNLILSHCNNLNSNYKNKLLLLAVFMDNSDFLDKMYKNKFMTFLEDELYSLILEFIIKINSINILQWFIKQKIDINTKDKFNKTALQYAIQNMKYDIINCLLNNGASFHHDYNKIVNDLNKGYIEIYDLIIGHLMDINIKSECPLVFLIDIEKNPSIISLLNELSINYRYENEKIISFSNITVFINESEKCDILKRLDKDKYLIN